MNNLIDFIDPLGNEVSADEIRSELSYLTETCIPYDEAYGIIGKLLMAHTHEGACSLARYIYPVPWVFNIFNPVLSLFYNGNAQPIDGYATADGHHNCEDVLDDSYHAVVICCGIGSGYVLLVSRVHD